jgi:hypothetical protein
MKKLMILGLVLVLSVGLVACKPTNDPSANGRPTNELPVNDTDGPNNNTNDPNANTDNPGNENPSTPEPSDDLELLNAISSLPSEAALAVIYDRLSGYWTTNDGLYIGFVVDGGVRSVVYGRWDSESSGYAELLSAKSNDKYVFTLTVHFPAMPATESSGPRPEMNMPVLVSFDGFAQSGNIQALITNHGNGNWYQYTYGGKTMDEAYRKTH